MAVATGTKRCRHSAVEVWAFTLKVSTVHPEGFNAGRTVRRFMLAGCLLCEGKGSSFQSFKVAKFQSLKH